LTDLPTAAGANNFLQLLPLALWSALYPTLLAMVVLIVQRPRPHRTLIIFYAGALVASFTAAVVVISLFGAGHSLGASNHAVSPAVDIAVGLLALALFWVLVSGRDRGLRERRASKTEARKANHAGHEPWSRRLLQRDSPGLTFGVALALNLPGVAYLVALKDIAESSAGVPRKIVWVVLYNLITFTLLELPIFGYAFAPDRTRQWVEAFNGWLGGHGRKIAMVLCATAGGFLVARGLIHAL
jgi:hypothetical protein